MSLDTIMNWIQMMRTILFKQEAKNSHGKQIRVSEESSIKIYNGINSTSHD